MGTHLMIPWHKVKGQEDIPLVKRNRAHPLRREL